MGDLISRSALLELFKSLRDEHETSCISYNALYELILQQKTAYDVEAKVAELENIKTGGDCRHKCKHYDWSVGWCEGHCEDYVRETAISIVRGKE